MTDSDFDILITQAMNELPEKYIRGLENVALLWPTSQRQSKSKR